MGTISKHMMEYILASHRLIKHVKKAAGLAFITLLASSLLAVALPRAAFCEPFNDVPKDHWAYDAIDKLVQTGYMDGFADETFRGRKVITRYELALVISKILTKVEDVESGGGVISPKDAEVIKKLAGEFRDELKTIGVRMDSLEQRVIAVEKSQKNIEKLKITGYYKASETFVWDRLTTIDDLDNDEEDNDAYDKNGLGKIFNQINLKFSAKPFDNVEPYLELKTWLNAKQQGTRVFGSSTIRPYLNNYMTNYTNERGTQVEKSHLTIKSQYANVRAYGNEDPTRLDDPITMLNNKGKNAYNYSTARPFSGVETKGTVKDVTYTGSVLKEYSVINTSKTYSSKMTLNDYYSNYPYLSDGYDYQSYVPEYKQSDIYAGRLIYVMPKRILKTDTAEVSFGTSFVEKVFDYSWRGNFSEANGVDLSFKFTDIGTLKATTEYLESRNGDYNSGKILRDDGVKLDLEYQLENLTLILNHYKYGKDFFISTARYDSLYTDTGWDGDKQEHWNYGHQSLGGERFYKLDMKYDMPFGENQKLKLEGIVQNKKWETDPAKPNQTDGYEGQKFSFQADADMAKDMTSKFYTELIKDALKNEVGKNYTEIEMNAKLTERISSTARFSTSNDADSVNKESKTNKENSFYGELSSQLLKNIWGKVYGKRKIEKIGWHDGNVDSPNKDNTEKLIDETGFETNFTLTPSLTLKMTTNAEHDVFNSFTDQNIKYNWYTTELTEIFTDKLKGRLLYWWKNPQKHDGSSNNNLRNLTAELTYDATDKTKMFVRYGDWIDTDQNWKDIETEKKVTFQATTDF